ncbi:MAG: hypothetical protein SF162_15660 [bacterium]|nr:hypothetical protein [bacterium]
MQREATRCIVCERENGAERLVKCANPRCRHYVCQRHALRYELSTDIDMDFADYCSRACYIEHVRKTLSVSKELWIAATVLLIGGIIYLVAVAYFL